MGAAEWRGAASWKWAVRAVGGALNEARKKNKLPPKSDGSLGLDKELFVERFADGLTDCDYNEQHSDDCECYKRIERPENEADTFEREEHQQFDKREICAECDGCPSPNVKVTFADVS